jgi:hypothetical protein
MAYNYKQIFRALSTTLIFFSLFIFMSGQAQAHPLDDVINSIGALSSSFNVLGEFITIGFTHILPLGADHILFVLGLFLLSPNLKPLFWQVTTFTLAHSVTLGLSIFGVISVSPSIVEPIIALSITFIAVENIITKELKPWRIVVIFMFGLIHGMGFAGVLSEIGLPQDQELLALIAFNIGVEFGQIAVIGLALGAVWFFRQATWYRARVSIPASIAVGAIGLFWFVERTVM